MFSIYSLSKPELIYWLFCAGIFGAAMGSFLNCAAWRIAHGESFLTGRSRCPACGHTLGAADLVPIFSWLFLRGRCRYCGTRVSPRYVLAECAFSLLAVLCLLRFGLTPLCLRNFVLFSCLFCLSLVDLDSFFIPDGCLIIAALAWVLTLPFVPTNVEMSLLAVLLYGGGTLALSSLMDCVLKKETLGGGDVKLFALMGLYLGPLASLFAVLFASLLGLLFAFAFGKRKPIPFGPSISAASALMALYGASLTDWYWSLVAA